MTLTLTLTPEKEARLAAQARQAGLALDDYVQQALDRIAGAPERPAPGPVSATAALFAQWAEEDKTDDPEELQRRTQETDDLLKALAENPISFRHADVGEEDAQDRAA